MNRYFTGLVCVVVLFAHGCAPAPVPPPGGKAPPAAAPAHAHPTEGPHHGDLIELGNEEYHGELLHDANSVTIYVLNGAADAQVPIEATEVTINVSGDTPKQYQLAAKPDSTDPEGQSSRFVLDDAQQAAELTAALDAHGPAPKLVLNIKGRAYRGTINHSHDHDHDH